MSVLCVCVFKFVFALVQFTHIPYPVSMDTRGWISTREIQIKPVAENRRYERTQHNTHILVMRVKWRKPRFYHWLYIIIYWKWTHYFSHSLSEWLIFYLLTQNDALKLFSLCKSDALRLLLVFFSISKFRLWLEKKTVAVWRK